MVYNGRKRGVHVREFHLSHSLWLGESSVVLRLLGPAHPGFRWLGSARRLVPSLQH